VLDGVVVVVVVTGGVLTMVSSGMPLGLHRHEQKERVVRRARELAESGRFEGWQGIAFHLQFFDGFSSAHISINGALKKELNSLCRNARIRRSRSGSESQREG
jgi:hypothetical protein